MSRRIGSVSVRVDADTGRLVAELAKGGDTAGRAFKKAAERGTKHVDVGFDIPDTEIIAQVKKLKARIEQNLRNIEANLGMDTDEAYREFQALRKTIQSTRAMMVGLGLETTDAYRELAALYARIEKSDPKMMVNVGAARAQIQAVRRRIELALLDIDAEVRPEVDTRRLALLRTQLSTWADFAGKESGHHFSSKFLTSGWADNTKLYVMAFLALGSELAAALEGALSVGIAGIGSALNGLVAGFGALTPVIAGVSAVLAGGVTGFLGFGDAVGAVNDEMARAVSAGTAFNVNAPGITKALKGLSDSARATALAYAQMRPQMDAFQRGIQEVLFSGFDTVLQTLATTALPNISASLADAAGSANEFGKQLAGIAATTDFAGLFRDLKPAVDNALNSVSLMASTIEPFLRAAAPAAERLSGWFAVMASNFREFVLANPDKIAQFLNDGLNSLKAWGELLGEVAKALGKVFRAGQGQGDAFVVKLTEIVETWNDWLDSVEGRATLQEFLRRGEQAMQAMKPLLDGLREGFNILVSNGALSRLGDFSSALGRALPVLAQLVSLISQTGALTTVLELFAELGEALPIEDMERLAAAIGDALATGLEAVGPLITAAGAALTALLAVVTPIIEGIAAMPAPLVLATAGLAAAAVASLSLGAALQVLQVKLTTLIMSNPYLLAMAGALAAVGAAWGLMTGKFGSGAAKARELAERTREVTEALGGQVGAALQAAAAGEDFATAMASLSGALTSSGEDGDKLKETMALLGLQVDDTAQVLMDIGKEPVKALAKLAESAGLTAEEAIQLAIAVESSDTAGVVFARAMEAVGDTSSISKQKLAQLVTQLEELQDQEEKIDFDKTIQGFLAQEAALGANNDAMLQAVLNGRELIDLTGDELVAVYEEFTRALADNAAAGGTAALSAAQVQAELEKEAAAARQAALEAKALSDAVKSAAQESIIAASNFPEAAARVRELGERLGSASEEADALRASFDTLIAPFLGFDEALDTVAANVDKLADNLRRAQAGEEGFAATLDRTTEAGRANREAIRNSVQGLLDYAEKAIAAGESSEDVSLKVSMMRQSLIDQVAAFTGSRESAQQYIEQLGLTPQTLETLIQQPGMAEALANADALNVELDEAGNPVITNFETPGLQAGLVDTDKLNKQLGDIPDLTTATVDLNAVDRTKETEQLDKELKKVDELRPDPKITLPGYATVKKNVDDLLAKLEDIDAIAPSVTILLPGINARISEVDRLREAIDKLRDKSVTITTRNVGGSMTGSIQPNGLIGAMAGRMINYPQTLEVGERGYREAVIPLDLPLGRVDPSVRSLAAMIRQGAGQGAAATTQNIKNIAPQFTIYETNDAETTAVRVFNRMAGALT